jgi:cytochrome c-type biogenesis protein CcmH/NrfG
VYLLAAFCLVLGVGLGYLFRGSASPAATISASPVVQTSTAPQNQPKDQKAMVEQAVFPLLATLKENPDDFDTIVKAANLYYDAQQYPDAIKFYERALKIQPQNVDTITDLGTSFWYTGDTDKAIAEFQTALKYQPGSASTLFNLGVVRWQGKMDAKGAVQAWEELLRQNPNFPDRQKLEQLIERAKQHANG